jgi:hypothetical protein
MTGIRQSIRYEPSIENQAPPGHQKVVRRSRVQAHFDRTQERLGGPERHAYLQNIRELAAPPWEPPDRAWSEFRQAFIAKS